MSVETHVDLDCKEVRATTEPLQEETAATTNEITLAQYGYTITQHVRLFHVVCAGNWKGKFTSLNLRALTKQVSQIKFV